MSSLGRWLRTLVSGDSIAGDAAATRSAEPVPRDSAAATKSTPGDFRVGSKTDRGQARSHNEDAILVLTSHLAMAATSPDFGLFMVADGMGGHQDGEAASALALRVSAGQLVSRIYVPLLAGADRGADQPALTDVVRDAVVQANRTVSQELPGSGCTLTCGMIVGGRLLIGHVGDSRAYIRKPGGGLVQLTRDHTFVNRLIEVGQLTVDEAQDHPQRNVLYRAIGQPEDLDVDVVTRALNSGDRLLLCSDGLWNMVPEDAIDEMAGMDDPQAACEALVRAANAAGGADNISVILVELCLD